MSTLQKLSQKTEEEETLSNSFYEASITLLENQTKTLQEKKIKLQVISLMNIDAKILNKILGN